MALRSLWPVLLFLVPVFAGAAWAAPHPPATLADDADDATRRLWQGWSAAEPDGVDAALRHLDEHVLAHSAVDATSVRSAWRAVRDDPGTNATRPHAAEAALLRLARDNVDAALVTPDFEAAARWADVATRRVHHHHGLAPALHEPEALRERLDSALAARAREAFVEGLLWAHAERPGRAAETLDGASALGGLLLGRAADRLPDGLQRALTGNVSRGAGLLADIPDDPAADTWPAILAPLVALQLGRDIEPLDSFAMRNVDAVLLVARAAVERSADQAALAAAAATLYAADRPGLLLRGEGTLDQADAAWEGFAQVAATGNASDVEAAARTMQEALRRLGLSERGVVMKVESGGVQPGRVHDYKVTLVRPPLEGIATYRLTVRHDPDVVALTGATPFTEDAWTLDTSSGALTVTGVAAAPHRRSLHLFHLHIEARGAPGTSSPLTVEDLELTETDGDPAEVFLVRHGQVTIAAVREPNGSATQGAPAPVAGVVLLVLATVASAARRAGINACARSGSCRSP